VAVIGYGYAGRSFHSSLVSITATLCLYGISSRDPATRQRIQTERRCKAFESFEQVIADPQVDLVVLATPHDTHADLAIRAMQAGKHVVTDKVMCLNLEQCQTMIATSRETRRLLTVFHNRRWDDDFLTLRRAMDGGRLGQVRWIEMAWQKHGVPGEERWRGRREAGGGKVHDLGAHLLDQILLLFPQPVQSVYARIHRDWPHSPVESHAQITVAFEGGCTGIIDVGSMTRTSRPRVLAVGTDATFTKEGIDPQEAAMRDGDIDAAHEDPANRARVNTGKQTEVLETVPGRWRSFYENVADVLCRGAEPAVKLPEMQRLMSVMDAVFESERTGQAVRPRIQ
jgi:scyllo-inositol 2-dehydrogenase (NADP+)